LIYARSFASNQVLGGGDCRSSSIARGGAVVVSPKATIVLLSSNGTEGRSFPALIGFLNVEDVYIDAIT
jgi:hypothetical protein